ncbi:PREDICTED: cyclic nucleotide-gated ion channel 1-like [Fragaria vesca subsp. vesca]
MNAFFSSNPDRNILRGQSSRQGGRHRAVTRNITATRWPTPEEAVGMTISEATEETVRANEKAFLSTWDHKVFIVSSAFATLVDPLYLYTYIVKDDWKCLTWDDRLVITFLALRTATDLVYMADFVLYVIYLRRIRRKLKVLRVPSKQKRHDFCTLLLRLYTALPIAQTMTQSFILLPTFPVQYMLRVYRIYRPLRLRPNVETGVGRWLKAILDFFPFVLAAHLYGALWYILAVHQEIDCWKFSCQNLQCAVTSSSYYCNYEDSLKVNITVLNIMNELCAANSTTFDFGIYLYAFQSGMTRSRDVPRKMLQGFWWGLQNLSSFGSNLRTTFMFAKNRSTSFNLMEIFFSILLCISGIVLFLIYLNERVQVSKKISKELKLRRKMQKLNPEIDLWLTKNTLPKSLKMGIMKNMRQKLEENNHFDVTAILSVLPLRDRRDIMSHLRLASLKKLPAFENMDERVMKAICEHLKPVIYAEDKYIFREGEPLEQMLFITQGTAWTYTSISNNSVHESSNCSSVIRCLEKGDFFGEEILEWATNLKSFSDFPVSRKVVKSQTKVEAFAIRANDLKSVVCKFWWHFSSRELMQLNDPHSRRWQHLAASSIQVKWRLRHASRLVT